MTMKTTHCRFGRLFVSGLVFALCALTAEAAAVRGRLDRRTPEGPQPVAGIAVTVFNQQSGRSYPSYTGTNGMFYLNVPAGAYILEIWISRDPRVRPLRYEIKVWEPNTDLPPIVLP